MSDARQPVVRATNQGRLIAVVGDLYRFLAEGSDTDGKYASIHATVPPGGQVIFAAIDMGQAEGPWDRWDCKIIKVQVAS